MGRNKRILCVFFPSFRLQAIARREQEGGVAPTILYRNTRSGTVVLEVSSEVSAVGVRVGMTLTQARVRCPGLKAIESDSDRDLMHLKEVAETFDSLSPLVALSPPAALICDMTGVESFISRHLTLEQALKKVVGELGLKGKAALSSSATSARAIAVYGEHSWIEVPEAEMLSILGALPVEALNVAPEALQGLRRVGLSTLSEVQRCDKPSLIKRYGALGERIFLNARGVDSEVLEPYRPIEALQAHVDFQEPCSELNALLFAAKRLLDILQDRLRGRGNAALRLCWCLKTEENMVEGELSLPRPQRSSQVLLSVLRERLSHVTLEAPVEALELSIPEVTQGAEEVEDLFDRRVSSTESLDALLVRLESSLGPATVCSPRPASSHRPESAVQWVPFQPRPIVRKKSGLPESLDKDERVRPFFLFPRPEVVEWSIRTHVLFINRREGEKIPVKAISAYERITGEWWREGFERDYYRVLLDGGILWWVFRDLKSHQWFLHGVFD